MSDRNDGWTSMLQGLGTAMDPQSYARMLGSGVLSDEEISALYRNDPLAFRIVDLPANDMTRRGFDVRLDTEGTNEAGDSQASATAKYEKSIALAMHKLRITSRLRAGVRAGRTWGGAIGIMGVVEDRVDPSDSATWGLPIDEGRVQDLSWIRVLDRRSLIAGPIEMDPSVPWYGTPEWFEIKISHTEKPKVHASRVLLFSGAAGSEGAHSAASGSSAPTQAVKWGWWDSVLKRPYAALRDFGIAHAGVARAINDHSVATYKMKGLRRMIEGGNEAQVMSRISIMNRAKSLMNAVILDEETESWEYVTRSVAGLDGLLDRAGVRLAASAGMPVTLLLEVSPSGFGTGESEARQWDDVIAAMQEEELEPHIRRVTDLLMLSKNGPTSGVVQPYDVEFVPLRKPSEVEMAETRHLVGQYVALLVQAEIVTADEAASSLFGGTGFSMDIVLDLKRRAEEHDNSSDEISAAADKILAGMRSKPTDNE